MWKNGSLKKDWIGICNFICCKFKNVFFIHWKAYKCYQIIICNKSFNSAYSINYKLCTSKIKSQWTISLSKYLTKVYHSIYILKHMHLPMGPNHLCNIMFYVIVILLILISKKNFLQVPLKSGNSLKAPWTWLTSWPSCPTTSPFSWWSQKSCLIHLKFLI